MSEQEQTQTEAGQKSAGVTHPTADQLHGRLLEDFKSSLENGPEGTYRRWGYAWMHSMGDEDAMAQRVALGYKPVDALDHYNLGCLQAADEDFGTAARSFGKAIELDATLNEARYNHALALETAGKAADARQAWKAYLEASGELSEEETKQIKDRLTALADA